jgi:hypothetical protein
VELVHGALARNSPLNIGAAPACMVGHTRFRDLFKCTSLCRIKAGTVCV